MKTWHLALLFLLPAFAVQTHAGWVDDIGYRTLASTFTSGVPTSVTGGVTQTEAADGAGNHLPDDAVTPSNIEFTGKTITNKGSATGGSAHASLVATYFYGNNSSVIPATVLIDAYSANDWINTQGIAYGSSLVPPVEQRRVQNHSWISVFGNEYSADDTATIVTRANHRLDFAINRDGFTSVVGVNNGASTVLPELLCQAYHVISVGLANGNHSAGLTAYDVAGRMKPDIVAFDGATSFATPQVSSAAGLLSQKLRDTTYSSPLATADYPRLTKALILAGASKEPLPSWSRASLAKPYDAVYGAGALNVFLSYRILVAGKQTASTTATVPETGWDVNTARTATFRTYFFDVPAGTTNARFSAALSWHRAVDSTQSITGTGATLANIDLRLYHATGFTADTSTTVDASLSTVDNVEHIYQSALAPGRYALRVSLTSGASTTYALAWRTSPTVNLTASAPVAKETDGTPGTFTITRTGSTSSPLLVPLSWSGSAVAGTHYTAPPATLLIPANSASGNVTINPISDDIAQGNRTVILSVATDFTLSAGATPSATVTVQDKPYDSWRFTHFSTEELADPIISGPTADPDTDGQTNFLEYALNADPKTADAPTHAPVAGTANDRLTLTYTRSNSATDVTYNVLWSTDLATWTSGATVVEPVSSTDNSDGTTTVVVRSVATLTATPIQFLRLSATRQ